ncbi:MAG: HAD-IA family hydrolase [Spirochaetes bacterium]|nr:HAD-IA family hydrolase [Spirochaetota bacterium]
MPEDDVYFRNPHLGDLLRRASSVILDMNGLIVDDEPLQLRAMNDVLAPFRIALTPSDWADRCAGRRSEDFTRMILTQHGLPHSNAEVSDIVLKKNERYRSLISRSITDYARPGVLDLVAYVKNCDRKTLSLATTASPLEVETILGGRGLGIEGEFDYIVTGADITRHKPDPEIYQRVATLSGAPFGRCLVFEDSGPGVTAASRAGMPCIAVPNDSTRGQEFKAAAFIVGDLTREARILDGSCGG